MAAPAETITHGTAQTYLGITDEPSTPTVKVSKLTRKSDRDSVQTKNTNGTTVYEVNNNPRLILSFEGQIAGSSTLATEGPGEAVSAVANFAATYRDFDYSVGIHILENIEDTVENLNRAPMTKFDIRHQPHIA